MVLHQHHDLAREFPVKVDPAGLPGQLQRRRLLQAHSCRPLAQRLDPPGTPPPPRHAPLPQGIHWTERARPAAPLPPQQGAAGSLTQSTSFHHLHDLRQASLALAAAAAGRLPTTDCLPAPIGWAVGLLDWHLGARSGQPRHCTAPTQSCSSRWFPPVQDWGALDYCFISPIFDSISKPGYQAAALDAQQLQAALSRPGRPRVIGLGGVTADLVPQVHAMGLDGVAVIGSVWQAPDPEAAYAELSAACDRCWAAAHQASAL